MQVFDDPTVKYGFATRAVPLGEMAGVVPRSDTACLGDLMLAEVLSVGKNKTLEDRDGRVMYLFPGDKIVGAFGNRYATDQYEGYVPEGPVEVCDMLSVGALLGEVASRHDSVANPTRLRILGQVSDRGGRPINQLGYGLLPGGQENHVPGSAGIGRANGKVGARTEVIVVIGSSMNSGKTTTAGTIARALSRAGYLVAAAKATGTAAGKDGRFYESCGAWPVLDFTSVGYPSTYMAGGEELLQIYRTLLDSLRSEEPDYVVVEVADGVFQRETRMLLESEEFRASVDHLFFAASDSLSAESGVRLVREYGLPLRATAGSVTQSVLASREAEEATGIPCLSIDRIMDGTLKELLDADRDLELAKRDRPLSPGVVDNTA